MKLIFLSNVICQYSYPLSSNNLLSKTKKNIPLAPLTTLKIGGRARFFIRAENENDIFEAFEFADKNKLDIFVLGGGSNVLIADKGFDGLVLQIAIKGIENNGENLTKSDFSAS